MGTRVQQVFTAVRSLTTFSLGVASGNLPAALGAAFGGTMQQRLWLRRHDDLTHMQVLEQELSSSVEARRLTLECLCQPPFPTMSSQDPGATGRMGQLELL